MKSEPRLLDKIVGLTSLRDVELLEFSLLKTIQDYLKPLRISILKVDKQGEPLVQTELVAGRCKVEYENIHLDPQLLESIHHFDSNHSQERTLYLDAQNVLTLHLLQQSTRFASYLVLHSENQSTPLSNHLVNGFIQVYRNFCDLLVDAQTDELTGLANRKTFEEYVLKLHDRPLAEALPHPQEQRNYSGKNFWLAIIDIDHFKRINDNYGHLYGDEVLVLLAQQLRSSFRDEDSIFRFGGEEFVAVLRAPDKDSCHSLLERLRQSIGNKQFPGVGNITISIGATHMTPEVFYITLLDYADKALYHSKNNGRDCTTFFEDMVDKGLACFEAVEGGDVDLF